MKTYRVTFQKNGEYRIQYIEAANLVEAKQKFKAMGLGKFYSFILWPHTY